MKSMILILILTLIVGVGSGIYFNNVSAADEGDIVLSMEGLATAAKSGTGTLNLKINSENDKVTTISGTIIKDEKVSQVKVEGINGWKIDYREDTGKFLASKTTGVKTEEFAKITYTVASNAENEGTISVSGIKITNENSEEKNAIDVEKKIKITNGASEKVLYRIDVIDQPTKTTYKIGEKFDKTGMKVTATYSDGTSKEISNYSFSAAALTAADKKVVIKYTEGGVTKEAEVKISVTETGEPNKDGEEQKDNTTSKNEMADTGLEDNMGYTILAISLIAVVSYVAYKKYSIA